jgi:predicted TIM-barrel fold metal-dependent hydrolase
VGIVELMLGNPALNHLYFDISWNEVAKYIVATPESAQRAAAIINRYPDRFLFGTDEVAPGDQATYLRVYRQYEPLWKLLTAEARQKVLKGNYERLFDAARVRVRQWEAANLSAGRVGSP